MTVLLCLYAIAGLGGLTLAGRLGRRGLVLGAVPYLVTLVWLTAQLGEVFDGAVVTEHVEWVPALGLDLDLRLDGFSALMTVLVAGVGLLISAYAYRYFPADRAGLGRLAALLTLFGGSMFGLVIADNVLVLYGFWELTSITSFLLIGNDYRDGRARAAALQALLITSTGALAMLIGLIVLGQAAGTYSLSAIIAAPPGGHLVTVALILILVGAFAKSAQYPFHTWLPSAMVAPTPVSAFLHSATMVKAGVYLVARLAPAFAVAVAVWRPLVIGVGLFTMVAAGMRALRQTDLKLLLAMGTISQLGFMIAVFGVGTEAAMAAGAATLVAHAAFKASLFMIVGILDHQHGTRDLRRLPRVGDGWRVTAAVAVVSAASMAGVPLTFGFVAKELDLGAFAARSGPWAVVATVAVVVGSALTVAYSLRFAAGALGYLTVPDERIRAADSHAPPAWQLVAPPVVLGGATLVLGLIPGLLDDLVGAAQTSLDVGAEAAHLGVWHGVNTALVLTAVALVGGAVAFVAGRDAERRLDRTPTTSSAAYLTILRSLNSLTNRTAQAVQPGSLPVYLGVIMLTAAVLPGALFIAYGDWPGWPDLLGRRLDLPIAAVIVGTALAASILHRRFTAALFLGITGYAMCGLFVLRGAPDLALTQVGIETLTTVMFVLVLRRLPDHFETHAAVWRKSIRILIAVSIGTLVFVGALATGSQDPEPVVSDAYIERSEPDGGGKNVVNVILVDFRGFDTMGEITVLTAAAIGTVALARAGRRPRGDSSASDADLPPPVRVSRLVSVEVSMRAIFVVVMTISLYLLFAGHNQPGGGFAGGIVAGAAVALRYISGGIHEVRRLSRGQPWLVLGAGVIIAAVTAIVPLLFGGAVLEGAFYELDPPLLGHVKLTSAMVFDIGVYLVVFGLALMMFESFGDDPTPLDQDLPSGTMPDRVDSLPEPHAGGR